MKSEDVMKRKIAQQKEKRATLAEMLRTSETGLACEKRFHVLSTQIRAQTHQHMMQSHVEYRGEFKSSKHKLQKHENIKHDKKLRSHSKEAMRSNMRSQLSNKTYNKKGF
jgi:hypothetical protein